MSGATLVESARAELAAIVPARRCDRLAELSALFHTAGTVHLRGRGALAFHLDVGLSAAARRAFSLLRELRLDPQIRTYRQRSFAEPTRYQLLLDGTQDALDVLEQAGVVRRGGSPLERPPGRVVARACCRAAYLRGAFLGGGSLTGPRAPHLEVRTPTHAGAAFVRSVASAAGVRLRVVDRARHAAAYAKGWEAIEAYLGTAGAVELVVSLEERALVADLRSDANRLTNADHANLVRQSRASQVQREGAQAMLAAEREGAVRLAPALRDAGELRLRYPSLSLRELGARADPPATKAAMASRLARLVELHRSSTRETEGG